MVEARFPAVWMAWGQVRPVRQWRAALFGGL